MGIGLAGRRPRTRSETGPSRLALLPVGEEPAAGPIRVQGSEQRNKRSRHSCDLCDKVIIGDLEWTAHLKSKKHHYHMRKKRKLDPGCDLPQIPIPAEESPSEDCTGAGTVQRHESSQQSSEDTRTSHTEGPVVL